MKIINDGGYNNDERESFREIIFSNTIQSMRVLVEAAQRLGIALGDANNEKYAKAILDMPTQVEGDVFPKEAVEAIKSLWADSGIQATFLRANEFNLNDSAK